jgi:hypothetical protein
MEDLIKALQIFLKYGNDEWPTHCEHDVMYVMIDPAIVNEADKTELDKLGFISNEIDNNFHSYRYGSA